MADIVWGEKAGLRPLRFADGWALHRFMSDPEVANLLFEEQNGPLPSPFLLGLGALLSAGTVCTEWAIVNERKRCIGSVRLWRISQRNRNAMLTIYIGDHACLGCGYGSDALRLALQQAFGPLDLNRVELHVFDFNPRAIRSYEKVGFVHEGTRREALRRGVRYHDILVMGITRAEFAAREFARRSNREYDGGN